MKFLRKILKKKKQQLEEFRKQNKDLEKPTSVKNTNVIVPQLSRVQETEKSLVAQFEEHLSYGQIEAAKELAKNSGFTVEQRLNLMNSVDRALPNNRQNREEIKEILRDNIDFTKEKSAPSPQLEAKILTHSYSVAQKYLNPESNPHLKLNNEIIQAIFRLYNGAPSIIDKVFEAKEFVADQKILSVLSRRNLPREYLDKYVDRIIQDNPNNKNLVLQNDAFCKYTDPSNKKGYVDTISIGEYQEKRNALKKAVGEGKFEDVKNIMGPPWIPNKYEYVLKEAKAQNKMELFEKVASEYIDYSQGRSKKFNQYTVGGIEKISRILDLTDQKKEDPKNAKMFAEVLHKKGITEKMIYNASTSEDAPDSWRTRQTLEKYEPYFALKDAVEKINSIDKGNTKELDKVQKQIDLAVEKMAKVGSPTSLILEEAASVKDPEQKQKLLMGYAKALTPGLDHGWFSSQSYAFTPQGFADFVEKNLLTTNDKVKNAEIILELTKNIKSEDKETLEPIEKLYNKKVHGGKPPEELKEVNEMFEKLPPKDLGKLLFREIDKDKIAKDSLNTSSVEALIPENQRSKFDKAVALLQGNAMVKEKGELLPLSDEQKQEAAKNMVSNLSFKQMSQVVKTVEGHEDYSKKNWLSKALTKFADCVCRRFSKLKTAGVEKGARELIEKGAGVRLETKEQQKVNGLTKNEERGR